MRKFLISNLILIFMVASPAYVFAQTTKPTPKPTPKNFGQTVKKLRQDTNAAKKTLQKEKKTGTITKEQFKTQKKALQQEFKTKKQTLKPTPKSSIKSKATPKK